MLPAVTSMVAGTFATAALLVESATKTPPAGAAALSVTVPAEGLPAVTLVGLRLKEVSTAAGFTVSVAVFVTPRKSAEIITEVEVATDVVDTVKFAFVLFAATVTIAGTAATAELLLDNLTSAPPAGAAAFSVTVPVDDIGPMTVAGLLDTDARSRRGFTVRTVDLVVPLKDAEMVTAVGAVTGIVCTSKLRVMSLIPNRAPSGLTLATPSLLEYLTKTGFSKLAAPLKVTLAPRMLSPPVTVAGRLSETIVVARGVIVITADFVTPLNEAEIVTGVSSATTFVVIGKSACIAPGGTVTVAGTAATAG